MFTWNFWKGVVERAIKSAANGALLTLGASDLGPFNVFDLEWILVGGFAGGAAVISVLMSIASYPLGPTGTASLVEQDESVGRHLADG